jgi:hypothetical protein
VSAPVAAPAPVPAQRICLIKGQSAREPYFWHQTLPDNAQGLPVDIRMSRVKGLAQGTWGRLKHVQWMK